LLNEFQVKELERVKSSEAAENLKTLVQLTSVEGVAEWQLNCAHCRECVLVGET